MREPDFFSFFIFDKREDQIGIVEDGEGFFGSLERFAGEFQDPFFRFGKCMFPVSSETTTTSASLSSVIPIAALCLMPKLAGMFFLCVIGRVHLAAAILPF